MSDSTPDTTRPGDPTTPLDVVGQAAAWVAEGVAVPEVERRLRERGLSAQGAAEVADEALARRLRAATRLRGRAARVHLLWGLLWCAGGGAVLAAGLLMAPTALDGWPLAAVAAGGGAVARGGMHLLRVRG